MSFLFKKVLDESRKAKEAIRLDKDSIDLAIIKFENVLDKLLFEACYLASEAKPIEAAGFLITSDITSDLKATDLTGGQVGLLEPAQKSLNKAKEVFSSNGFNLSVTIAGANLDKIIGSVEFAE